MQVDPNIVTTHAAGKEGFLIGLCEAMGVRSIMDEELTCQGGRPPEISYGVLAMMMIVNMSKDHKPMYRKITVNTRDILLAWLYARAQTDKRKKCAKVGAKGRNSPKMDVCADEQLIQRSIDESCCFVLCSNDRQMSAVDILREYKAQDSVEKSFGS